MIILSFFVVFRVSAQKKSSFIFYENEQGLELSENGKKVFFYQKAPLLVGENPVFDTGNQFNHYIHPLYNLNGKVITEANPSENRWHAHHRGIFWGWHQILVDGVNIGDSWIMDNINFDITNESHIVTKNKAELNLRVKWISTIPEQEKPIIEEHTRITTYALLEGKRIIDFEISLKALVSNVEIGGSKDTIKGYGGFSARIHLADSMLFLSKRGSIMPIAGQLDVGSWVDFSTPLLHSPDKYGITLLCHPSLPIFPPPWIIRSESSMQNSVFPGYKLYSISTKENTVLRYRVIIHNGEAKAIEINEWNKIYKTTKFTDIP